MATIKQNISRKTGDVLNWKWTALLGRDERGKQIRIAKRVEPYGLSPAREQKEQQKNADEWEQRERAEYEKQHGKTAEQRIQARKLRETITVVDFIDLWLKKHVHDGKHTPDSIQFFESMAGAIKAYFQEQKPGLKLSELDKVDILDYLSYLRNEARKKNGEPYSAATIQHRFSTLRNILEYGTYIEFISEDPCKKIKPGDRPKRAEKEIDFLSEEDAVRFISALDSAKEAEYWKQQHGSLLRWKCLVNALILTGLRRGELVGLQWGDLDKKKLILNVRRNVTIDTSHKGDPDPEKKIHVGELKGKRGRKVPISRYMYELLTAYKAEQEEKYGGILLPSAYIFCAVDNPYRPLYPTEPTRLMRKYIKRHYLPNMSPHDLRHTAASLAISNGASVKEVQALLGHRDPAVTLRFYAGITEAAQRRTVEGIEDLLRPAPKEETKSGG